MTIIEIIKILVLATGLGLMIVSLVSLISTIQVYGWFIKEEELDRYLASELVNMTLSPFQNSDVMANYDIPDIRFIAKTGGGWRYWYIRNTGLVSPFSKWHKNISTHYKILKNSK